MKNEYKTSESWKLKVKVEKKNNTQPTLTHEHSKRTTTWRLTNTTTLRRRARILKTEAKKIEGFNTSMKHRAVLQQQFKQT